MLYFDDKYKNITLCALKITTVLTRQIIPTNVKEPFYLNTETKLSTIKHTTSKLPGPDAVSNISNQNILGKTFSF